MKARLEALERVAAAGAYWLAAHEHRQDTVAPKERAILADVLIDAHRQLHASLEAACALDGYVDATTGRLRLPDVLPAGEFADPVGHGDLYMDVPAFALGGRTRAARGAE
jgi:hypothetical protein